MPTERFQRNSQILVTDLQSAGFVIYVPPQPDPLRFTLEAWSAIDALDENGFSRQQLSSQFKDISLGQQSFDEYFQWLLDTRVILHVKSLVDHDVSHEKSSYSPTSFIENIESSSTVSSSRCISLFTLNPDWPIRIKNNLLGILNFQLWLVAPMLLVVFAYLLFFLLSPAPSALNLLGFTEPAAATEVDVLVRILIGLLSINLISTVSTWLVQSLTNLGDGEVLLRFLFGIIPRFGVNSYKGAALQSTQWDQESKDALLCISQPLISRLTIATLLIVLISSGRLQSGLAGSQLYSYANVVLQISLFSGLILALPFRMSPGYRLMILLTDLPPNTIGRSVKHLYDGLGAFKHWLIRRDKPSFESLKATISSWQNIFLLVFAGLFIALIVAKVAIISLLLIPRLSVGLPAVFGRASQFIFSIMLWSLLLRFLVNSILPKLRKLRKSRRVDNLQSLSNVNLNPQEDNTESAESFDDYREKYNITVAVFLLGVVLLFPINRTVSGSVAVSTERALTVRVPADVRIKSIFQLGPSTKVVSQGTVLAELFSSQLERDLYSSRIKISDLRKELATLKEQKSTDLRVIAEVVASLQTYGKANKILDMQLEEFEYLMNQGAFSRKSVQDQLLKSFQMKDEERLQMQTLLKLRSDVQTADLIISSTEKAIGQSISWQKLLLEQEQQMTVTMPFDGLITSSTSGLMDAFLSKGEPLFELKEGSLNVVNVLIPDHDRSLISVGDSAEIRLYSSPNKTINGYIHTIRPISDLIDQKIFFQASLRLSTPLDPQLFQSSGAARIICGKTNLIQLAFVSVQRFLSVDVWSWTP